MKMIITIIIANIYWVRTMSGTMLNVLHNIIPFNPHKSLELELWIHLIDEETDTKRGWIV